jgi:hypothetical protein
MEVTEIVSYYYHEDKKILEVSFRLNVDNDDEVRNDTLSLEDAKNIGFELIKEELNLFEDEDDFFDDFEDFVSIDEDLLLSYLNEYYIVNPDKLPKVEFF